MKTLNRFLPHLTPFVMLILFLVPLSIYTLITDGNGWGGVAAIAILFFSLILLLVDLILKKVFKKYIEWFAAEVIIGVLVLTWYYIRF